MDCGLAVIAALTLLFFLQPAPVKSVLGLSGNLGPAKRRFEMSEDRMVFQFSPSPNYKNELRIRTGPAYDPETPSQVAIWLENQGAYHIKTLLAPDAERAGELPYWSFKRRGWRQAKRDAERRDAVDAVSSPTPNGSFDPAD